MSLLGKILAFLNIVGVGAFLYMAAVTYAKRQTWEYANFRTQLVVDGLPVDDKGVDDGGDTDKAGLPNARKFTDQTIKELFPTEPRRTQVQEVERVSKLVNDKIASTELSTRQQLILRARFLMALAGRYDRVEIYPDREFYLSMMIHLADDKKYEAFKKALVDAFPIAVTSMRFETQDKPPKKKAFASEYEKALADLPGDEKFALALAFLNTLSKDVSFAAAMDAAKKAAEAVEAEAKKKPDAEEEFEKAKKARHIASAEAKANPIPAKVMELADKEKAMNAAEAALKLADEAFNKLPRPSDAAALAFVQTIRKDKNKKIPELVDEVLDETLKDIRDEYANLTELALKDAFEGALALEGAPGGAKLIRDHRREAIARYLLAAIDILDDTAYPAMEAGASILEQAAGKRFVAVVGVEFAIRALNAQTEALRGMFSDLAEKIASERGDFARRHNEMILALRRSAAETERLKIRLQEISDQANEQTRITKDEGARVDGYVVDLQKSRSDTANVLSTLMERTNGLNQVRIAIRDAIRANDINLRKIEDLEEEIIYLKQKIADKEREEKDKKRRKATMP